MTIKQVKKNVNPTGKGGFADHPENINRGGRHKNSLKAYIARKLAEMSDKEKEKFLETINRETQWRMGEGNPDNNLNNPDGNLKTIIIQKTYNNGTNKGDSEN